MRSVRIELARSPSTSPRALGQLGARRFLVDISIVAADEPLSFPGAAERPPAMGSNRSK